MDKLNDLLKDYSPWLYHTMPKCLKQKVNALRKIQYERLQVELEFHREMQELELKYAKLYEPFESRRAKIVSGQYEPTEEECKLPESIQVHDEEDENAENEAFDMNQSGIKFTDEEEKLVAQDLKGIPYFWLAVLNSSANFSDSIESHDKPILKYLTDIQVKYKKIDQDSILHAFEFHFDENPFFSNRVLTKNYTLKLSLDEADPFAFDGHELVNIEGCKIDWIPGQDPTVKSVTVKQKNKNDGSTRNKSKSVERDSFFHFFSPPIFPLKTSGQAEDDAEDGMAGLATLDFELAEMIRQNLVQKAVLYFSGELLDDDDEGMDGDYDDDDEEEDEDDEEDSFDEDDDETGSESGMSESASEGGKAKGGKKGGKKVPFKPSSKPKGGHDKK